MPDYRLVIGKTYWAMAEGALAKATYVNFENGPFEDPYEFELFLPQTGESISAFFKFQEGGSVATTIGGLHVVYINKPFDKPFRIQTKDLAKNKKIAGSKKYSIKEIR